QQLLQYKNSTKFLKFLLEEYFENVNITDTKEIGTNEKELKEYKKVVKEIKDATRNILKEHKEIFSRL
ncbi:hypothetical protein BM534_08115, partial [Clostridioides difficile]